MGDQCWWKNKKTRAPSPAQVPEGRGMHNKTFLGPLELRVQAGERLRLPLNRKRKEGRRKG